MSQSNTRLTTIETRKIVAEAFQTHIRDERVIQATARILEKLTGEKQPTDAMSAMLFGNPDARRESEILDILERGLKINITRDSNAAEKAKKIRLDGRDVETWVMWYRSNEFRLASMSYMNIDKIWAMWPAAFDDPLTAQNKTPIPAALTEDTSKFVPPPAYLKAKAHAATH